MSKGPRKKKNVGGRPPFVVDDKMRGLVKLLIGYKRPHAEICSVIVNPQTGRGIDVKTFKKEFAREIEEGEGWLGGVVASAQYKRIIEGSDTAHIWWQKNHWGYRDSPEPAPKTAEQGTGTATIVQTIEIVGGLPVGSTRETPEGTEHTEVPPEELK